MEKAVRVAATRAVQMWLAKDFRSKEDTIDGHIFYYSATKSGFNIEYMGSYDDASTD